MSRYLTFVIVDRQRKRRTRERDRKSDDYQGERKKDESRDVHQNMCM